MIYRLEITNKDGKDARLDITTPGSTLVKTIEGTENPFILSYKSDKSDKSGHFYTSSMDINIYETSDFNIDVLKTSSETDILVEYFVHGVKEWIGYVIPDFFSREITENPVVSMVASDRLNTLKSATLTDYYLFQFISIYNLAINCLNKTGLFLPLKTMADFEVESIDSENIENAFFKSYVLYQQFQTTGGRKISCYDILLSILVASNSILIQRHGEWHIINKWQLEHGAGYLYSSKTERISWVENIHYFNEMTKGAMRSIVPVASSVSILHKFAGNRNRPKNYDFSNGLASWFPYGNFITDIDNHPVIEYACDFNTGIYYMVQDVNTWKNYLINQNSYNKNDYLISSPIPIPYKDTNSVNVEIDIHSIGPKTHFIFDKAKLRFSVYARYLNMWFSLNDSDKFVQTSPDDVYIFERSFGRVDADIYVPAEILSLKMNGLLEGDNLSDYSIYVRIYGGGANYPIIINHVKVTVSNTQEMQKGNLYKRAQGVGYTKVHDTETSIFGDFITNGLNGYFYNFSIEDISLLYELRSGLETQDYLRKSLWTTFDNTEQLPLLQHVVQQRAGMFSIAHDMIKGEVDIALFDPLSIFVDCNNRKYVINSAEIDFLRSTARVELEEIKYGSLTVKDYIYSYFDED